MSVPVSGNVAGVKPGLLSAVEQAVAAVGGTAVRVTSGRRTPSHNAAVGGAEGSAHLTGDALDGDAYIPGRGWVPLGTALEPVAGRFGLRSGATFTWNGKPDVVHVDDRVAGSSSSSSSSSRGVPWQTELLNLLRAPQTPANYQFLNQWATREHAGGPQLSDGSNNPFFTTAGAGGTVGPLKAGTFPSWNSVGVARFPTLGVGVWANALHISTGYPAIARALRSGTPAAYANDPSFQGDLTRWSGGGYQGFASIPAPSGPVGPTLDPSTMTRNVAKASNGGSGGGGFVDDVTGYIGKAVTAGITSGIGSVVPGAGAIIGAAGGAGNVVDDVLAVPRFLGKLADPHYIIRGLQLVAGAGLIGMGTLLLVRQVALAADMPDPLSLVGGSTLKTAQNLPGATRPSGQGGSPGDAAEIFKYEPGATRTRAKREDLSPGPKPVYSTRRSRPKAAGDEIPF